MATPTSAPQQPLQQPTPLAHKSAYHFRDRVVVTGLFTKPYEIDFSRLDKKTWPWQTTSIITSDSFIISGTQKLSGGICSVNFEAKIICQAKIEYVQRLYQLRATKEMSEVLRNEQTPKRIKTRLQNTIERELGTTQWDDLITEAGLLEIERRINEAVFKDLDFNNFGGTCICNLSEPAVHGLDVDGKTPRLILGADAGARLKEETHKIETAERNQRQQHARNLEMIERAERRAEEAARVEKQNDLDTAAKARRAAVELTRRDEIAALEQIRTLELAADTRAKADERSRNAMIDTHEWAVLAEQDRRKEFDAGRASTALIAEWQRLHNERQEEMKLEADLREKKLASRTLDGQYIAYEADMIKLDLERARLAQEKNEVEQHADQEHERAAIQLLRERIGAEHSWEIERLDHQAKALAQALEKIGTTNQPIERVTIMHQSGDAAPLPNSPAYLLGQAAMMIRELFSLLERR